MLKAKKRRKVRKRVRRKVKKRVRRKMLKAKKKLKSEKKVKKRKKVKKARLEKLIEKFTLIYTLHILSLLFNIVMNSINCFTFQRKKSN